MNDVSNVNNPLESPAVRLAERFAPKDGTAILMWFEDSDIPHPVRWKQGHWVMTWDQSVRKESVVGWIYLPLKADKTTLHTPHTCAGFVDAFYSTHKAMPSFQEVWSGAIKSLLERQGRKT